jgi:aromatic ring-cleaving dioxygenase
MKTKRNKPRQRFDLRRREFDGKIIKWETKRLSELGILPEPVNGKPAFDHQVDVVTGVYNSRKEAFA